MKELKDYTAELHRRIEEKTQQQRTNRRRAATLGVTLALTLLVTAAVSVPRLLRRQPREEQRAQAPGLTESEVLAEGILDPEAVAGEQEGFPDVEMSPEGAECAPGVELYLPGAEGAASGAMLSEEKADGVLALVKALDPAAFAEAESTGPVDVEGYAEDDPSLWMLLTDSTGRSVVYTLEGRTLIRGNNEARFELTDVEYRTLIGLLGLE